MAFIDGNVIIWVNKIKYLGVFIVAGRLLNLNVICAMQNNIILEV